jgi:capsular exopolysaccharide synthesis family protein
VLIKGSEKTHLDIGVFNDLGVRMPSNSFENELEIINSETLMKEVFDTLNLGISYYEIGHLKDRELYKRTPVFARIENPIGSGSFRIRAENDSIFSISSKKEKFTRTFNILTEPDISSPWGILHIEKNPLGSSINPVEVRINKESFPLIAIVPVAKASSVVNVSLNTPTPKKGIDIINCLLAIYNQRTIEEKNYVANQTIHFIDSRLVTISSDLKNAEKSVEHYKKYEGLTDIKAESGLFLAASNDYSKRIAELETQLNLLEAIRAFLVTPENKEAIAPANIGLTDPTVLSLLHRYNEEIFAKNKSTIGMTRDNPKLQEFDDRIALLRDNVLKGISLAKSSMQTISNGLKKQESAYMSKTRDLSSQERELGDLYRQKAIKENLFIYLLQKREDTSLSLALATPNALVIDPPTTYSIPIKPKSETIFLFGFLIGLLIPIGIVYLKDLFDTKLRSKEQLKKIVKAPFLGEISISKTNKPFPVLNLRSRIAEDFRIISSNLSFIAPNDRSRIIMVTSSYSGEGKSFFSSNLAMSLATTGKKTLLIDLDMRKSVLNETLDMNPQQGVAMYLADTEMELFDVIDSATFHKNLDIIPLRILPPNPAELLASDRLTLLLETSRSLYDYIIVDTAPIGLVADAFRLNPLVDASIYVTRIYYTEKSVLNDIQALYAESKLQNICTILNAIPVMKHNKYGNYYTEAKEE